jgi:hypothetical protein
MHQMYGRFTPIDLNNIAFVEMGNGLAISAQNRSGFWVHRPHLDFGVERHDQ